jgi:hypothetical protein
LAPQCQWTASHSALPRIGGDLGRQLQAAIVAKCLKRFLDDP